MIAVFTGPSLPGAQAARALPGARVNPPAARGDLARAVAEGADTVLLIDGAFAHRLAVPPSEIVAALRAGARVLGAASLGAIRAAECHPAGSEGVGAVAALFRLRVLADDDEVAVAVEPDRGHRAASVALVHVRFAVLAALRAGWLDRPRARAILAAAKATHFSERRWPAILAGGGVACGAGWRELCRRTDVKRRDAERAVALLARGGAGPARPPGAPPGPPPWGAPPGPLPREPGAERYPGHDRLLGHDEACARAGLTGWLRASGRARRYGEGGDLWRAADAARELDSELMRWHAVCTGAGLAASADGPALAPFLAAARAMVARAHGFGDWAALEAARIDPDARTATRAAAHRLALARRNLAGGSSD